MSTFEPPTIASDIWSPESLDDSEDTHRPAKDKYTTGSKAIDDAFEGGLDFGAVQCITSKPEHGGQDLFLALLATHLLRGTEATATVIDSTLTFDVRRLHQAIQSTIGEGEDAMEPLTRLKISKVFDRVGMVEAIAELGEALQSEKDVKDGVAQQQPTPTPVIEDSEDEEEILEDLEPATPKQEAIKKVNPSRLLIVNSSCARYACLLPCKVPSPPGRSIVCSYSGIFGARESGLSSCCFLRAFAAIRRCFFDLAEGNVSTLQTCRDSWHLQNKSPSASLAWPPGVSPLLCSAVHSHAGYS